MALAQTPATQVRWSSNRAPKSPDINLLSQTFHEAAKVGDRRRVKRCLKAGVPVDCLDKTGRTALFTACIEGHENVAELLLKYGADVNHRIPEGSTPLHAASYGCSYHMVWRLVELGGDVRLHDVNGLKPIHWAARQMNLVRRNKNYAYLLETQNKALTSVGLPAMNVSSAGDGAKNDTLRSFKLQQKRNNKTKKQRCPLNEYAAVHNFGYGTVFVSRHGDCMEVAGNLPLILELSLKHDDIGYTYNNGEYFVMESMLWNKTKVTVKRLHREPSFGGNIDLLIHESEQIVRLRHPCILLMMAVCQTNNMEGLVLLYERIHNGSLFTYLYHQSDRLTDMEVCRIFHQLSCGLQYVHQRGLLHCALSSHAVQLVANNCAKLTNFEYAVRQDGILVEIEKPSTKSQTRIEFQHKMLYKWTAPEVLAGGHPCVLSDVYGLCCVLWETLNVVPPWQGANMTTVIDELTKNGHGLSLEGLRSPFDSLLRVGLTIDVQSRHLTVEQFHNTFALAIAVGRFNTTEKESRAAATPAGHDSVPASAAVSMTTPRRKTRSTPRHNGSDWPRHRRHQQQELSGDGSTDEPGATGCRPRRPEPRSRATAAQVTAMAPKSSVELGSGPCSQLLVATRLNSGTPLEQAPPGSEKAEVVEEVKTDWSRAEVKETEKPVPVMQTKPQKNMKVSTEYGELTLKRQDMGDSLESSSTVSSNDLGKVRRPTAMAGGSDAEATYSNVDAVDAASDMPAAVEQRTAMQYSRDSAVLKREFFERHPQEQTPLVPALWPTYVAASTMTPVSAFVSQSNARRDINNEQIIEDMEAILDHALSADTVDADGNPFRSQILNKETLEMYHELLNRPLPRLPKLYTLPPKRQFEEIQNSVRRSMAHSSTVCGSILRHYVQDINASALAAGSGQSNVTTSAQTTGSVQRNAATSAQATGSGHGGVGARAPPSLITRTYRPTFGISLNELKAAIAPRAAYSQRATSAYDETDRSELFLTSGASSGRSSRITTSRMTPHETSMMRDSATVVGIQPASHHRPDITDMPARPAAASRSPANTLQQPSLPQRFITPSRGPTAVGATGYTAGSTSNPFVVSGLGHTPSGVKATALPTDLRDNADYMHRFRSDPVLLYGEEDLDLEMERPCPPPSSPVADRKTEGAVTWDDVNNTRKIRTLISQYQEQVREHSEKQMILTMKSRRSIVDASTDPMEEADTFQTPSGVSFDPFSTTPRSVREVTKHTAPGGVTIRRFHYSVDDSADSTEMATTVTVKRQTSRQTQVADDLLADGTDQTAADRKLETNGEFPAQPTESKHSLKSKSETDEESTNLVSNALQRAEVELAIKYANLEARKHASAATAVVRTKTSTSVTHASTNTPLDPKDLELKDLEISLLEAPAARETESCEEAREMVSTALDHAKGEFLRHRCSFEEHSHHQAFVPSSNVNNNNPVVSEMDGTAPFLDESRFRSVAVNTSSSNVAFESPKTARKLYYDASGAEDANVAVLTSDSSDSESDSDYADVGDLYFDDEFNSANVLARDRHLRLQSTLGLDPPSLDLSEEFRSPGATTVASRTTTIYQHQQRSFMAMQQVTTAAAAAAAAEGAEVIVIAPLPGDRPQQLEANNAGASQLNQWSHVSGPAGRSVQSASCHDRSRAATLMQSELDSSVPRTSKSADRNQGGRATIPNDADTRGAIPAHENGGQPTASEAAATSLKPLLATEPPNFPAEKLKYDVNPDDTVHQLTFI